MIDVIVTGLWFLAFLVVTFVIGKYLAGVVEFKDWKWPWR